MAQAAVSLPSPPQIQFFQPPSPPSPYCKLREMDELLDSAQEGLSGARQLYQRTLKDFAGLCHDLWQQEKAQGNREGKGFRKGLREAGIKVGRAYQAMKKFFPSDFPTKRKSLTKKKFSTLFIANKVVGSRFIGKLPEGKEALQCIFALTPEEKAEFTESLNSVDAAQLQQLFLQAVKQVHKSKIANKNAVCNGIVPADVSEAQKSQIPNNDAVCNGIPLADVPPVTVPNTKKSEIKNQKSEILQDIFLQLDSAFPSLLSQVTGSSLAPQVTMSRQMRRFQQRKQEKKQRRMERFLDQLLGNGQQ